jgi:fatty acid desaturase
MAEELPANAQKTRSKAQILQIKELCRPNVLRWLADACLDWAIIVLTVVLAHRANAVAGYIVAALVIGNRQHALAILGHEGAHYNIHRDRKLNDFLANLMCFWPLLVVADGYRRLHFQHHNHTGTARDPELLHKKARAPQWDLPLRKRNVLEYVLKDLIGYALPDLWIILTFSQPEDKKLLRPVAILLVLFLGVSVAAGLWWLPLLWYGSLGTSFMMFFRLRLWIEHQGTFDTQRVALGPVTAALLAPHKIWLHWEHHEFPIVPYFRLEQARGILSGPQPATLRTLLARFTQGKPWPSGATKDIPGGAHPDRATAA